jgi:putative addiction module CopG family antidote
MDVSLTPELEKIVTKQIAAGKYQTPDDVIRAGLRALDYHGQKPGFVYSSEQELREKLQEGIESLDRGEGIPGTNVIDDLRKRAAARRSQNA